MGTHQISCSPDDRTLTQVFQGDTSYRTLLTSLQELQRTELTPTSRLIIDFSQAGDFLASYTQAGNYKRGLRSVAAYRGIQEILFIAPPSELGAISLRCGNRQHSALATPVAFNFKESVPPGPMIPCA